MRVNGSFTLNAPVGQVWAALTDPAVLAGAIPGCEGIERADEPARLTVMATVAATTAAYAVDAQVTDRRQPDSVTVALEARGEPGALTGTLQLQLADSEGATRVSYEADAEATGQLAAVGRSLLAATVKRLATRFLEALDEVLTREPVEAASPAARVAEAPAAVPMCPAAPEPMVAVRQRMPGQGFTPGVLVGAAIGVAAAKLGSLLARRRSR
jgi:hypothetical protein